MCRICFITICPKMSWIHYQASEPEGQLDFKLDTKKSRLERACSTEEKFFRNGVKIYLSLFCCKYYHTPWIQLYFHKGMCATCRDQRVLGPLSGFIDHCKYFAEYWWGLGKVENKLIIEMWQDLILKTNNHWVVLNWQWSGGAQIGAGEPIRSQL